jgi:hypothetical protein
MIRWLKELRRLWLPTAAERRQDGREFAVRTLASEGRIASDLLHSYVEISRDFDDFDEFDKGILEVLEERR